MSEPKTDAASNEANLVKLEQAVKAEAGKTEAPETSSDDGKETDAPHGQAFQSLAEKKGFKDVDDLVKAYQNVEGSNTKVSQELKEIRDEIRKSNTPQTKDPYKDLPKEQKEALMLLRTVVQEEIGRSIKPLKEDYEVKRASKQLQDVRDTFPGVSDTDLDEAISRKEKAPGLSLEDAVKIVTYESAKSDGTSQKRRAAKTQQKKRAYVESAKTSKTGGEIDYTKLSLEELENILPAHGQFIDHKGVLRNK